MNTGSEKASQKGVRPWLNVVVLPALNLSPVSVALHASGSTRRYGQCQRPSQSPRSRGKSGTCGCELPVRIVGTDSLRCL